MRADYFEMDFNKEHVMKAVFLATFCLLGMWSVTSQATSYFVADVKSQDGSVNDSLKSLITSAVSNAGGQVATSPATADFVLKSEVVKLGQAYVLTVTRMKNDAPLNSSRQKAAAVEELDDAADRAVRAAMLSTQPKKDLRVGEVKQREEDQLRRRIKSLNLVYFGIGPATFNNMGTQPLSYDLALGYNWEVTPNSAIRILADGVMSNDWKSYFADLELGLNYMFTDEASSPYVGGLLGFGFSGSNASSATTIGGFSGTIGLGWLFFRTSSTQLDLFASYSTIFGNNTIGAPGVYGLRVGVLF